MADSLRTESGKSELQLGLFINNQYVTVKKIGVGGFGVVWQAYDFSLRNFIAIKELLPDYAQPKFIEMFYKEALIAKNIIHDNIVRVQHFWQGNNGSYYVVLDYVRGIDLEILIRKCNEMGTKIPWMLSTFICMSVLKAIDYANRIARDSITGSAYGIVYRDISPGNVLLSFDGNIKLSDFGVAKTADELKDSIPEKVITGKYPYMSPEQIKGIADIDHRTDIFSVAVLYYEMLTGKQLYQGTNDEIREQVLNKKFDTEELNKIPEIPAEIIEVIAKALEKDRENRYEKAIEMYRDIRRVLKGVETDELSIELAEFINNNLKEYVSNSEKLVENVKALDITDVQKNEFVRKINCQDFIAGQVKLPADSEDGSGQAAGAVAFAASAQAAAGSEYRQAGVPKVEEKGKTVFEEVGDWLFTKLNDMKKSIIRLIIAVILAVLIFAGLDIFVFQFTPPGKEFYSRIYPPDVIITTIPAGAVVSMKTKDGEKILNNVSSSSPIPVRKVLPKTYIVSALKDGFKPVQRVVQIERSDKSKKVRKEKIEIMFDFVLNVDSYPAGANVFIDGNKFGVTPCKVQLLAGAHTVKLSLEGFEDLGSNSALAGKDGQCDIDFSKTGIEEMFAGVDRKFWDCELKNIDGENIFSVKGTMFKRVNIGSEPDGMTIHVQGEDRPRGNTPMETLFRLGEYKIRLMDPNARFGEMLKTVVIDKDTNSDIFFKLNKIVTLRVRSKDDPGDTFITKVTISNENFSVTKDISTTKPIKIPLPVDVYDIVFHGDGEYKPHKLYGVDIGKTGTISGILEYADIGLSLTVKDKDTSKPIANAFIWQDKKILGKTNKEGVFKNKIKPGKYNFKIVAKDYLEQTVRTEVIAGRESSAEVLLDSGASSNDFSGGSGISENVGEEKPTVKAPDTSSADGSGGGSGSSAGSGTGSGAGAGSAANSGTNSAAAGSDTDKKIKDMRSAQSSKTQAESLAKNPAKEKAASDKKSEKPKKPKSASSSGDSASKEQQVIVCLNCGYVNTAPAGKKLRFCVNCAKSLK